METFDIDLLNDDLEETNFPALCGYCGTECPNALSASRHLDDCTAYSKFRDEQENPLTGIGYSGRGNE